MTKAERTARSDHPARLSPEQRTFLRDVLNGLAASPKAIPSKYFYDEEGSRLFDRICELDVYYPTRTELAILRENGREIVERIGADAVLVEPGAGALTKVRTLLDFADGKLKAYVPLDISGDHLIEASAQLGADYPDVKIIPVVADFSRPFDLGAKVPPGRRVGFFPGSTIGNFTPEQARGFLTRLLALLGPGSGLVIGVDLQKDIDILEAAYDDREGVTAAFNLNLLKRINAELGGDFMLERFAHKAFYNREQSRIEMHLVSVVAQTVTVAGQSFTFDEGETIHTENSCKYTVEGFAALAEQAGWRAEHVWTDDKDLFSVHYLATES
jgi:dimethylhistidine N-methyltransferase